MHVTDARALELAGQPEPAVDADHHLKGEPGLQPQVHEPELRVLKIKIVVEAFAGLELEMELVRRVVAAHEVGQARLHAVEDADEPVGDVVALGERTGERVFALGRGVEIAHRPAALPGEGVGGIAHAVAQRSGVGAEVLQQDARRTELPEHEGGLIKVTQTAPQPQPVVALDYARDIRAVLRQKLLHAAAVVCGRWFFHTAMIPLRPRLRHFWLRPQPR